LTSPRFAPEKATAFRTYLRVAGDHPSSIDDEDITRSALVFVQRKVQSAIQWSDLWEA
jgi:hypothetical protein